MSELKYKVGDKVRIKNIDWYNENKDKDGEIVCGEFAFLEGMKKFCSKTLTILEVVDDGYLMLEDYPEYMWTDEMIEGLVEAEIKPKFKVGDKITNGEITFTILTLSSDRYGAEDTFGECGSVCFKSQDDWKIVEEEMYRVDELLDEYEELTDRAFKGGYEKCKSDIELNGFQLPEGYIFKDENGNVINATKIVLEKKKKEYPKTFEECVHVLEGENRMSLEQMNTFRKLIDARNAYWKLYGEEMGLGKPWEPDWTNLDQLKYCIWVDFGEFTTTVNVRGQHILAFPTEEMRDAFYEAFKNEIELVKELL